MPPSAPLPAESVEALIRNTGARVTTTRVRVLTFLQTQTRPLTHHEIQEKLAGSAPTSSANALDNAAPIDSVTLYRVLEWLTENELVHRVGGADQVWRFSAGGGHAAHEHAHFQCTKCDTLTCFTEVKLPERIALPAGFQSEEVDFLIKGICPRCG